MRLKTWFPLVILGFSMSAFAGGSDSGGGNVCFPGGGKAPIALDLATDGEAAGVAPSDFSDAINLNLPKTDFLKKFNFDVIPYQLIYFENPNFQKFMLGLLRISAKSPYAAQVVMVGLAKQNFMLVDEEFKTARRADYGQQSECGPANTKAVIVYNNGMMALSRPVWNKLPYGTQATILIHEILRNVQSVSGAALSDRDLQNLTARLMANFLGKGESTDAHPFLADFSPSWSGIFPNLKNGVSKIVVDPGAICDDNRDVAERFKFETAYDLFCEGIARDKILYFDLAILAVGAKGINDALGKVGASKLSPNEKRMLKAVSEIYWNLDLQTVAQQLSVADYQDSLKPGMKERMLKIVQDFSPVEAHQTIAKDVASYKIEDDRETKENAERDFVKLWKKLKEKISSY